MDTDMESKSAIYLEYIHPQIFKLKLSLTCRTLLLIANNEKYSFKYSMLHCLFCLFFEVAKTLFSQLETLEAAFKCHQEQMWNFYQKKCLGLYSSGDILVWFF